MLIDLRTYTLRVGTVRDFLAQYAREGLEVQRRHLGAPLGYYTTEVGDVNEVVHIWQYADAADRERRRAALESDPQWLPPPAPPRQPEPCHQADQRTAEVRRLLRL